MRSMNELKSQMLDAGLESYFEALSPLAKNAVSIEPELTDDDAIPLGASKFGGCPDLPAGVEWFRMDGVDIPLSFIAQVNFAEAAEFDTEKKLPAQGMLYFFYDCSDDGMPWGFDPEDAKGWKVFFHDSSAPLERRAVPADLEDNGIRFGAARMRFDSRMELPAWESDLCNDLDLPEDEEDAYWEWLEEQEEELSNKLLGHSDNIQGGMELECEYVTSGIYCGNPSGYAQAKARGLDKNASRWNLLMQVESNEDLGMMWGDMGRLYLWITDEDLAARSFEKCWMILQCG